jgi:ribosome-associated protein
MLQVNDQLAIPTEEIEISAVRAQGPGGQNVNKVSSAIHLRFDIMASSLPDDIKQRLLQLRDRRINSDGVVVIKAQSHRSQDKNRSEALARLAEMVDGASRVPRKRIRTSPTRASKRKRLDDKKRRASLKRLRGKPGAGD